MPRIPLTVSLNVPALVAVFVLSALSLAAAQGEDSYQSRCALCHGGDAAGTDRARSILPTLHSLNRDRLATIITEGVSQKGMPAITIPADELGALITYLKEMAAAVAPAARDPRAPQSRAGAIRIGNGRLLNGTILKDNGSGY